MDIARPAPRSALQQSMSQWSSRTRLLAVAAAALLTAALAVYFGHMMGDEFQMYDGEFYILIARGQISSTIQPFASRQLGALVVRALAAVLHVGWRTGFVLETIASLGFMLGWIYLTMSRTRAPAWLMAASTVLPFWRVLYHGFILPDLFYGALLCVFLALLEADSLLLAAVFLFPLMLARESTSLTLLCFLLAAWKRLGWRGSLLAIASTVAGSAVVGHLTAGIANREKIPQGLYMLAKVPWNAIRLTGIQPWANLYPMCENPTSLHAVHLGPLRMVGLCPYIPETPAIALALAIVTFGLLPLLVFFALRAHRWKLGDSVVLRFAVIYGVVTFLLAPLLGTAYDRLFGYAWPLVLVALPRLWTGLVPLPLIPRGKLAAFLVLHLLVVALSIYGLGLSRFSEAGLDLACVIVAWFLLRKSFPQATQQGLTA